MTRKSLFLVLVLAGALILPGAVGMAAPGTGRLPWSDYQNLLRLQVMGPGATVPEKEYMLQIASPITEYRVRELEELGITLVAAVGDTISVRGPVTSFEAFGPEGTALPWVRSVTEQPELGLSGSSEFYWVPMDKVLEETGADQLHALNVRGNGVKIGIIDGGFTGGLVDMLGDSSRVHYIQVEYQGSLRTATVTDGFVTNEHGEACSQAIAAIAPEATFYLMSAASTLDRLALLQFIRDGEIDVDILSDSTYYGIPLDHNDGYGLLATLGDEVVESGVSYIYALGNLAAGERTDRAFYGGLFSDEDGDKLHDFTTDATTEAPRNSLEITVHPWEQGANTVAILEVIVAWDGWPHQVQEILGEWTVKDVVAIQDIDVHLSYKMPSGSVIPLRDSSSRRAQLGVLYSDLPNDEHTPWERIVFELKDPGTYLLQISNVTMAWEAWLHERGVDVDIFERNVDLHLYVKTATRTSQGVKPDTDIPAFTLEHHTVEGSIINMGGAHNVIGVGAVGWTDNGWCVTPYSSRGPTSDGRLKPELVAPTSYESQAISNSPYFSGTSASAPVVAGLAALLLQVNPTLTPEGLLQVLCGTATQVCGSGNNGACLSPALLTPPLSSNGWNHITGCGFVNVLNAYQYMNK